MYKKNQVALLDKQQKYKKFLQTSEVIPVLEILSKTTQQRFLYGENGLSKLIPRLKFRIHTDARECFALWNKFNTDKSLFALWDFRTAFHDAWDEKRYFLTIYNNSEPIGLLPLAYDEKEKVYEWYGTEWQEENKFYQRGKNLFPLLFTVMPAQIKCNSIIPSSIDEDYSQEFIPDDPQFYIDITNLKNVNELFSTFSKKHRYNFRRDYMHILEQKPQVEWITSPAGQVRSLFTIKDLSIKRFGEAEDKNSSMFRHEKYLESFINIVKNQGKYKTKMLVVKIQGKIVAIDMIAMYDKGYYLLQGASDLGNYSGLGNFICYLEFEDAIKNGFEEINALQEDNNWKHRYFSSRPLLKLKK
ncbi:hypothetical protein A3B50_01245 [Candidatus Roizmanbacteria bacterium RIFCSPLOWO2_01_FULL_40_42]|uniref:BioF2-like acetyltransferase domain-containing protein n=1 Tax=Candidatus Roizmanbacteria bacterium RIFCSPLOWO2_01_FULL_40_42 TaxID=1802066 RepID=A0A1F7J5K6_9BACT|nr:MAG: hypothetical protein A2779_03110 [Candidatus Roizmanbacteria bacterium RIFCSPHIGHO2_01_FULL_40_98]OGK28331.1 MAG: hypothetical protein A3C31_00475 [Candidatus Roizmanbacteria bacterium RIFCSPHIGHO2_02_FULL_40_53]OGK30567.1 MAG: hypothetical protein A2W49_03160 [Candidatus Roizmanbacteria bacterium RIFCSPHIGHO2_12_41_18]OGK36981.1 MAG: hypothetical protein A3E69_00735 [Candidatus Roizmanbacteria bacterium RIFCSPHIGHO2_12_FULL_40_130]OGK50887.1 MAG: hypothetical protein A3B50_01245 [Candi